jgi:hypothetical protein
MKELLDELKSITKQKQEVLEKISKEFKKNLKQIFDNDDKLESFSMPVSNHEFNDGEATIFYICYDSFSVDYDGKTHDIDYDTDKLPNELQKTVKDIKELFKSTDVSRIENIHEYIFGNEYSDEIYITRELVNKY